MKENQVIANKYQLIEKIAEGGMNSVIWKAKRLEVPNEYEVTFKPYCAIKIVHFDPKTEEEQISNTNKEINVTARAKFKSDAFCELYDKFWIEDNQSKQKKFAIVMELVDGMVLSEYLKSKGMIPLIEAMEIYEKILLGIKSLHNMNSEKTEIILHRDLKLDNVMLTSDFSEVKIIDLGIATVLDNSGDRYLKIHEQNIYGSMGYVPPEVKKLHPKMNSLEKAKIITEFWDIFAAGVILYLLLTAEFPYRLSDRAINDVYLKPKIYDFPTISSYVPEVSGTIENILYKSLVSKDEEKHLRYKNIDEILKDIDFWKKNPDKKIPLLKPAENRNLEKIENFFIYEAKYEIASIFWFRSLFSISVGLLMLIFTFLLIFLTF